MPDRLLLDVYGCHVEIHSNCEYASTGLAEDFAYFRSDSAATPDLFVELREQSPPYEEILPAKSPVASVYTPRNVSYRLGSTSVVDYAGRALGVHDRKGGRFRVFSRDPDLLYEAAYLFLLSQCGEFLDAKGLHRIHAVGISVEGRGALVLLPMGGGKSTLAAELLREPDVQLISDDSPLVDAHGGLHSFPLRLGLLPGSEGEIPKSQLRTIQRMEFGPKLLVNYSYFADRVCDGADPGVVFLGRRTLNRGCTTMPAGFVSAVRAMLYNCVVGIGLFQGMEFVFSQGPTAIFGKAGVAAARLTACLALLRRSRVYYLDLGRDSRENAAAVLSVLRQVSRSS